MNALATVFCRNLTVKAEAKKFVHPIIYERGGEGGLELGRKSSTSIVNVFLKKINQKFFVLMVLMVSNTPFRYQTTKRYVATCFVN